MTTPVLHFQEAFVAGVAGLRSGSAWAALLGATALAWLLMTASYALGAAALGLSAPLEHFPALVAITALGVTVPTPAGSGTYHAVILGVVGGLWGLAADDRAGVEAYAILGHLVAFLPVIVVGVYYLVRDGSRCLEGGRRLRLRRPSDPAGSTIVDARWRAHARRPCCSLDCRSRPWCGTSSRCSPGSASTSPSVGPWP